jgi:glutaminyl-tRNA synthetase
MPTISGLRRRGFTPESIKDFCDRISVTRKESVVSYLLLEECLRVDLNKRANRLMGVMDPVKVTITNWIGGTEWVKVENNPEDETAGKRMIPFSGELWIEREDFSINPDKKYNRLKLDGEVRLKGAYVIKAEEVVKDSNGEIIEIKCTYDPLTRSGLTFERKIKGTIHWVSIEHGINIPVNEYDRLFSVESPSDDFINELNPNSLTINDKAVFEPHVLNVKVSVQMMRKGYYILDKDGKSFNKTVSLKEGWVG